MSRCENHWRGQHKFEPRYDTKLPRELMLGGFEGHVSGIEKCKDRTYVRDVCVRCGQTVERIAS